MNRLLLFNLATDADDPVLGFTTAWIRALAEHCERVDVVTMRAGRMAVPANVGVYSVGKEKGYGELRRAVEFYRILGQLLRAERYDACFAHMMPLFAVMGAPLLKLRRMPMTLWYSHRSVTGMLRLAERLVDRVVTATPEGFRLPSRKVVFTGHGIDVDAFCPGLSSLPPPFTVISVGRLAPIKRVETLIEAGRLLVKERGLLDVRIRLIGGVEVRDAGYAESLRQQVVAAGLDGVVEFLGPIPFPRIADEYRRAHAAVNLCPNGGMDKAVLEAMSCAVPALTTNEAFRPMLEHECSLLWIPEDSPAEVAERLAWLAGRSELERRGLGERLRTVVVLHHSLESLVRQLIGGILHCPDRA